MTFRLPALRRNAALDAVLSVLDAGGSIEIRTGGQPASADDAATGTVLATITLDDPAFGDASGGSAALAGTPVTGTGVAAGTAGWARAKTTGGATVFDASVTVTDGGGDLTLATTTVSVGLVVRITSGTITM